MLTESQKSDFANAATALCLFALFGLILAVAFGGC